MTQNDAQMRAPYTVEAQTESGDWEKVTGQIGKGREGVLVFQSKESAWLWVYRQHITIGTPPRLYRTVDADEQVVVRHAWISQLIDPDHPPLWLIELIDRRIERGLNSLAHLVSGDL